ncbi:MAG: 6-phosphogluconolactonase [Vicinamibacteria bacterium]
MTDTVRPRDLALWCRVPADALAAHPSRRVPLRVVKDSAELGEAMALELADLVATQNARGVPTRAIVPCGPTSWYAPWRRVVNERRLSLARLTVFHMDECLDAQARPLPRNHPYNFRTFMEREFYGGIPADLNVPEAQRYWLAPSTIDRVLAAIDEAPVDLTLGGWGQDGHVAYNQARRHPFQRPTLEDLAASTARVQENNLDTILALAHRTFGAAYQFVPPMSVTLGMRECLSARKVRLFSDTGAWKQTALRVALFSEPTPEYPITLLQRHADALLTATRETARHPLSEHPEWELF